MLHYTHRIYLNNFILKPLLLLKNQSFSHTLPVTNIKYCILSFCMRKHRQLLMNAFKASNFLYVLSDKRPRFFFNRKTGDILIWNKLSAHHAFLILYLLTEYLVTNERKNSLKGPFLDEQGTTLVMELYDLMYFNSFLPFDCDYYEFNYPITFSFITNSAIKSVPLLETWNLLYLGNLIINQRVKFFLSRINNEINYEIATD